MKGKGKGILKACDLLDRINRTLVDHLGDAIHVIDENWRIVYANEALEIWLRSLGFTDLPIQGRLLAEAFDFLGPSVLAEYQSVFASGHPMLSTEETNTSMGTFLTETRKIPILEEGRVVQIITAIRDLTANKQAEDDLSISRERLRAFCEALPDPAFILDEDGRYVEILGHDELLYNGSRHLRGKLLREVLPPDVAEASMIALQATLDTRKPQSHEYCLDVPAGRTWFHSRSALMRQSYDGKRLTVWVTRNITDLKEAEAERQRLTARMQQAQKLESLGILAGGIAHDFNNLLVGILGFADLALQTMPADSPALKDVERIKNSARKATELTNQMLAYSGRATFLIRPISLTDMVRDTAMLLESSISKEASLHFDLSEKLPFVKGDVSQIRQIVMNLITNASEALEGERGDVYVRTDLVRFSNGDAPRDHLDRPIGPGPWVLVEVRDTGSGIDGTTRARIFDPFFTTKVDGRGLGLAAVLGIVTGHNGAVSLTSQPGKGTCFSLYLPPMDESELEEEIEGVNPPRSIEAHGTILVVDDEATVREVFKRMLPAMGFEVLSAASGEEALATYRLRPTAIRAVILDASMPGIGGARTLDGLRALAPRLPILLCSGFPEEAARARCQIDHSTGFLQKPFDRSELESALLALLA